MMLDADHLRIVFYANSVGFVMPVADLLAIRGEDGDVWAATDQPVEPSQVGFMVYRETNVAVYSLTSLFGLSSSALAVASQLLVFAGADFPWALTVDRVAGVVDAAQINFQDLPGYLFCDGNSPYDQVAFYEGQLLISIAVEGLDQAWRRSE
jgi:hypothetical protein